MYKINLIGFIEHRKYENTKIFFSKNTLVYKLIGFLGLRVSIMLIIILINDFFINSHWRLARSAGDGSWYWYSH